MNWLYRDREDKYWLYFHLHRIEGGSPLWVLQCYLSSSYVELLFYHFFVYLTCITMQPGQHTVKKPMPLPECGG